MSNPIISVIIPVYNTAQYLNESIESVINQSFQEIEIIIIDDGSSDNSLGILKQFAYKDNRIKLISQKNHGQSVARNVGIEKSIGKYIYFMDSDDILFKNALEICYKRCKEMQLEIALFDGDIFYEKGSKLLCWDYHRTSEYDSKKIYNGFDLYQSMISNSSYRAVPWLYLINKDYLDKIKLSFLPGIIHEDELFTSILFIESKRVGIIKETFVRHRVRNNSTMGRTFSFYNVKCYFRVIDTLFITYSNTVKERAVEKYIRYTLNGVMKTAFVLPYRDKMIIIRYLIKNGLYKYIDLINYLRFILK